MNLLSYCLLELAHSEHILLTLKGNMLTPAVMPVRNRLTVVFVTH